jgi:quercetin dioxygenase-like cupin family protein
MQVEERVNAPKVLLSRAADRDMVPGRRDYLKYMELGLSEATNGALGAQLCVKKSGVGEPTGWHYHICDYQLLYKLSGWTELIMEDGSLIRYEAGDFLMIPGGVKHNEVAMSTDAETLEICIPAAMGTVICDSPLPD